MSKLYQNRDWLYGKYWNEKLSSLKIAKICDCRPKVILGWMRKLNIKTRNQSEANKLRDYSDVIMNGRMAGNKNPSWKGGRLITKDGYVRVHNPDHPMADHKGYIAEHRLIMSLQIGRYLKSSEEVHHRDGNRQNNVIGNLKLVKNTEHKKRYADGYKEGFATALVLFLMANKHKEI